MSENIVIGSSKKYIKKIPATDKNNQINISVSSLEKYDQNAFQLQQISIKTHSDGSLEDVLFSLQSFVNFFVNNICENCKKEDIRTIGSFCYQCKDHEQQKNNFTKILCELFSHIKHCQISCYDAVYSECKNYFIKIFNHDDDLQMIIAYNVKMNVMTYILKKIKQYARDPNTLSVD